MPTVSSVLIQIPEAVANDLTVTPQNQDLFEDVPGKVFLALYCQPSEYKPIVTELGNVGENGLLVGYSATFITVAARLEGFEISTVEGRQEPVQVLQAIQAALIENGFYQPITVYDGHALWGGREIGEINGRQYAERSMKLVSITQAGGNLHRGLEAYSAGFTVRFSDVSPRR